LKELDVVLGVTENVAVTEDDCVAVIVFDAVNVREDDKDGVTERVDSGVPVTEKVSGGLPPID
jgi:hypothetical protein